MSQALEMCQNCLQMFPQSKIPTHFGYCRRNIKKCDKCGQMYDINFQEDHEEEFHKTSPCPYCKNTFPASDLDKHTSQCQKKPKFCEYCQLQVPVSEFPAHLRGCESRTKQCEKCRKAIMNKDFLIHLTTCKGIVEQLKPAQNFQKMVEDQRNQIKKPEPKKEYANVAYKPQMPEKKEYYSRPKEEIKKPEVRQIKRQVKHEYKYEPKQIVEKRYEYNPIQKPIQKREIRGLQKKQSYKIQQPKEQRAYENYKIHQSSKPTTTTYSRGKNEVEVKPVRREIFQPRQQPTFSKQQPSNKQPYVYSRQQPTYEREKVPQRQQPIYSRQQPIYSRQQPKPQQVRGRVVPEEKKEERREERKIQRNIVQQRVPNPPSHQVNGFDEDQQLQRAILQSMGQKVVEKRSSIPRQFYNGDAMNESFMNDIDIGKQMAMMQEFERKRGH